MTLRDPRVSMQDMLDHAEEVLEFTQGMSRAAFKKDRLRALAVTRLLHVIGEAANRIDKAAQARSAGIDWAGIVGLRNRLVHAYDNVDLDVVWESSRRTSLPWWSAFGNC